MEAAKGYGIRAPQVVSETVDGEVIVVDLATGNYYSLRDSAAYIWNALIQGVSVQALLLKIRESLGGKSTAVDSEILDFIDVLVKEGLLLPATRESSVDPVPPGAYQKPVFEKFSDMQEFLLVDPIHEVNIRGWPYRDGTPGEISPESEKRG